ncbi:hypothetical protein K1T71_006400 [Dendrolimus kikuchii]|uniref:Uncharacterized protein n=1 Tax=Dendrolimus kikuchii TaxID=765133 RepID=A0ACC1D105_9NEOP|nr:hypothetical protein K1T71_006400 [Dendrolimus kikuchii]
MSRLAAGGRRPALAWRAAMAAAGPGARSSAVGRAGSAPPPPPRRHRAAPRVSLKVHMITAYDCICMVCLLCASVSTWGTASVAASHAHKRAHLTPRPPAAAPAG